MAEDQLTHPEKLIVIGGSSGSLEALMIMLPKLKKDFSIPVLLILHRSIVSDNGLAEVLGANTALRIKEVDEKDLLLPGWIFIAPPDYHVLLEADGSLSLDASEKVFYSRPSIDVSFRSAAEVYKNNCTAVLLSGANADGAEALNTISKAGGVSIVQDPAEATVSYMPEQGILLAKIKYVLPAEAIAAFLNSL